MSDLPLSKRQTHSNRSVTTNPETEEVVTEISETSQQINSRKIVQYEMPKIGLVVEEMKVFSVLGSDNRLEKKAIHNVFINGNLVRVKNLITNEIIKSDSRYEPYSFLQINEDTTRQLNQESYIPISYIENGKQN